MWWKSRIWWNDICLVKQQHGRQKQKTNNDLFGVMVIFGRKLQLVHHATLQSQRPLQILYFSKTNVSYSNLVLMHYKCYFSFKYLNQSIYAHPEYKYLLPLSTCFLFTGLFSHHCSNVDLVAASCISNINKNKVYIFAFVVQEKAKTNQELLVTNSSLRIKQTTLRMWGLVL